MFYILMAIAMLAALSAMIARGNRTNTGFLNDEQVKIAAQEIIDYGNAMAETVQRLRLRGCADDEISFDKPLGNTAVNNNAPADKSCHVYDINGGKMKPVSDDYFPVSNYVGFAGSSDLLNVGTYNCGTSACADLYMVVRLADDAGQQVCAKINELMGNTTLIPLPSTTYMLGGPYFDGTYGTHKASNGLFSGLMTACYNYSPSPTTNYHIHVLIAR